MDASNPAESTVPLEPILTSKKLSKWRVRATAACTLASIGWLVATDHKPVAEWRHPLMLTSLAVLLLGVFIRSWAAALVQKRKVLATTGVYALCRHPLYLGSILMVAGFCGLVGNIVVAVVMCAVIVVTIWAAISFEEQFLKESFGADWTDYTKHVSRLFPTSIPRTFGEISIQRWRQNREVRVWIATVCGLAVIEVWMHWWPL